MGARERQSRGRALLAAASVGALTVTVLTATGAAQAQEPAGPIFVDGQAQIVPEFADSSAWIRQQLWVETEFDTDGTASSTGCTST
ncbi:MAG: hypothetical protein ACRDQD_09330 [Nocardioidaceae bacterium]